MSIPKHYWCTYPKTKRLLFFGKIEVKPREFNMVHVESKITENTYENLKKLSGQRESYRIGHWRCKTYHEVKRLKNVT